MKKSKQLLFFIIPTGLIILNFIITYFSLNSNAPKYIIEPSFYELYRCETLFQKALFNTFIKPIIIALPLHTALYISKIFLSQKIKTRFLNVVFYTVSVVSTMLIGYFLSQEYTASAFYTLSTSGTPFHNNLLLIYAQMGIISSFIFWLIDCYLYRIKKRLKDGYSAYIKSLIRRTFAIISFIFSIVAAVMIVSFFVSIVNDYQRLDALSSTSGSDYLGIAVTFGAIFFTSLIGFSLSCLSVFLFRNKIMRIITASLICLMLLTLAVISVRCIM